MAPIVKSVISHPQNLHLTLLSYNGIIKIELLSKSVCRFAADRRNL